MGNANPGPRPDGGEPSEVAPPVDGQKPSTDTEPSDSGVEETMCNSVIVRYGMMRSVGEFRCDLPEGPQAGTKLVVRTDRGVELGEVVVPVAEGASCRCVTPGRLREFIEGNGEDYPLRRNGKVLRLANTQDIIDQRHLDSSAREEGNYCRQLIREMGLKMRLVTVEHLLGGERIVFYFTAESRVDFRELVKQLASQYRTRIEMRQVGARDEARLVADYERCGQRCCCQQFIKDLKPVSMRMAKLQKATLDPSKISGRCGRLMCCLRYEDDSYRELKKALPHKKSWVRTETVIGRVVGTQVLTQLVRIQLADGTYEAIPNEEIIERGMKEPPSEEVQEATRREAQRQAAQKRQAEPPISDSGEEPSENQKVDQKSDKPGKKKRRRRRRKKPSSQSKRSDKGQASHDKSADRGKAAKESSKGNNQSKKKRRRRRRKKKQPSAQRGGGGGKSSSGGSGS